MHARTIQGLALAVTVGSATVGGAVLPSLQGAAEDHGLRYTHESVEGAPPWVAIGTAVGALRGLVVDVLWLKVQYMKEQGLFYEVMADADLITKLQPRFSQVWAFHGHNMAYNISVATHTEQERWDWVNSGIRLVRNEGLRYNPNDLRLYKELAFWFAHKIEGYSDDAHLYYKSQFTREWHLLLGRPPDLVADRVAWMQAIADAPSTLAEADAQVPGVLDLVARHDAVVRPFGEQFTYRPSYEWLEYYGLWQAVRENSAAAEILGMAEQLRRDNPFFAAFDELAADPALAAQWDVLVRHTRKRVLLDDYNMDPQRMAEFTAELGPIDWRHGQAHALYWARLGERLGGVGKSNTDDVYQALNNDRLQMQALQGLARYGRISYDPFSSELPSRFPEPRFTDTIERQFVRYYNKYYDTRGAGGEGFIGFLQNFMSSEVRQAYRSGEWARAQQLLDQLDERFGSGASFGLADPKYSLDLEAFVAREIRDEYQFQPHLAPSEAVASMQYAFRVGVGQDRDEVWEQALVFVNQVITIFKQNEYYDYENKFGVGRMADLLQDFPTLQRETFKMVMTNPGIPMAERATIWQRVDRKAPTLRLMAYDAIGPRLYEQLQRHELGRRFTFEQLFPAPPGLEAFRAELERRRIEAERAAQEARERAEIEGK